jgi:hypothetical protein
VKQLLASSAARVVARAAAARRGGAGRGPAKTEKRRVRCWRGTWRGEERHGAAGARRKWLARAAGSGAEKNRERRGWRLKTRIDLQFPQNRGTPM